MCRQNPAYLYIDTIIYFVDAPLEKRSSPTFFSITKQEHQKSQGPQKSSSNATQMLAPCKPSFSEKWPHEQGGMAW